MYMTVLAASPCAKMVAFLGNSAIFLATPAESRKAWASKASFFLSFVLDLILLDLAIVLIQTSA